MNRVLRSPEISEKRFLIPARASRLPATEGDEETVFKGFSHTGEDTESGERQEDDERREGSVTIKVGDPREEQWVGQEPPADDESPADSPAVALAGTASTETDTDKAPDAQSDAGTAEASDASGTEEDRGEGAALEPGPEGEGAASGEPADAPDAESTPEGETPGDETDATLAGQEDVPVESQVGAGEETAPENDEKVNDDALIGAEEVAERDAATGAPDRPATEVDADALPAPASEIESIVEERLQEFEARYQQEKEDAYQAGFEDGTSEGTKQGLQKSAEEIDRFRELVDTLTDQWNDSLKTYDTTVVDLAVRIARKIVEVEIEKHEDTVLQAVQDCLSYVEDKSKVIIRVNPEDLETVRRHRNDWLESLESIDHLLIEGAPQVLRGGCIVETPIGDVDAQIEERLERLRTVMLETLNTEDDGEDA